MATSLRALRPGIAFIAGLVAATATSSPATYAGEPCCTVISVDAVRGAVTAFERRSGNIFTFTVRNRAALANLKPCLSFDTDLARAKAGQPFAVDLGLAAVPPNEVRPSEPVNEMTSAPGTAGRVLGVQPHGSFQGLEILLLEVKLTEGNLATATCLYCNGGTARVDLSRDLVARSRHAKLLDTTNRIEYPVMRPGGAAGRSMLSDHGAGVKLDPHQTARMWMTFSAPGGNTVTLIVPGAAAPFQNVPVSK